MGNKALICGNGFSMNFDNEFGNIMDRLYESHLSLKRYGEFDIVSNIPEFKAKGIENYNSVLSYLNSYSKENLYNLFDEALKFGKVVLSNEDSLEKLKLEGYIKELTINISELSILKSLIEDWENYGLRKINIEYITILIYFYYQIGDEKLKELDLYYNKFVKVLRIGDINKYCIGDKSNNALGNYLYNGFTTYYRLLFSIAIFNNGKAISLNNLNKISDINLNKVVKWLGDFESIFTLNYDKIMESIIPNKKIIHLHGEFELNYNKQICNYQSLRMKYKNTYVSFSDILIGDYIYNKTTRGLVNVLASQQYKKINNKEVKNIFKLIESEIKNNEINEILILGLNLNNDQHIIRGILTGLYFAKINNPIIKYCYFTEDDRKNFKKIFKECLTFGDDLLKYIDKNVKVEFISTQNILNENFYK
ncbi:hypothetical protein [Clostridium perfringens]|uniref:hypothetical protein n=1 Tax=Clostridium perfringens TaxID=1502 RepID=UPI0023F77515|nr:hypothetical protein [Clostridium perfringens]MDH5091993.1 hypothetical protein [Clostridium perfringens]WEV17566.1 hypothetical protein PL323_07930 [Clostridium perfringens D]